MRKRDCGGRGSERASLDEAFIIFDKVRIILSRSNENNSPVQEALRALKSSIHVEDQPACILCVQPAL
jgi:hypothetical protein